MRLSGVLNPEHEISAVRYSVCLPERFVKCQQVPGGLFPRETFHPFEAVGDLPCAERCVGFEPQQGVVEVAPHLLVFAGRRIFEALLAAQRLRAEVADVTTGVPQAIASSWGMPKLSRSEV